MGNRTYRPLQMHRIPYTDLTEAQVADIIKPTANAPSSKSALSNALQTADQLGLESDSATAIWNVDVQVAMPLEGDSTVAQMARLQGMFSDLRGEAGRLEARYEKARGQWRMAGVRYLAA